MELKEWIIPSDIYDSTPYECPYCGARIEMQRNKCPHCDNLVKCINFETDPRFERERLIETLIKLP